MIAMINTLLGQPPNASEHGYMIDHMLEFSHWFMAILFVGWTIFFLYTVFRFRKTNHPKADYYGVRTKASTHIEFMVVLVDALLLLVFALPLWARRVTDFPKGDAVTVRVIAQQFRWLFHYPGEDGKFGKQDVEFINANNALGLDLKDTFAQDDIISPNELHIPKDRNVILQITSKDVIHSFSLQCMRIGQDAIPGTMVPIWFRPIRVTDPNHVDEIICGQLCGLGHYNMRALMYVDTIEDYNNWVKTAPRFGGTGVTRPAPS